MALTKEQKAEIHAHLKAGRKIEAIKRYRELTGLGLAEAMNAVTQMAAAAGEEHAAHAVHSLATRLDPRKLQQAESVALAMLRQGNAIEAIKRYRQQTGIGLKEAKEAVDALTLVHRSDGRINPKLAQNLYALIRANRQDEAVTALMSQVGYEEADAKMFVRTTSASGGTGGCMGGCLRGLFALLLLVVIFVGLLQGGCNAIVKQTTLFHCLEQRVLASSAAKQRLGEPLSLSSWLFVQSASGSTPLLNGREAQWSAFASLSGPRGSGGLWMRARRTGGGATANVTLDTEGRDEVVFSGAFSCPTP